MLANTIDHVSELYKIYNTISGCYEIAGTYMRYFRMLCTVAIELQRERARVGLYILRLVSIL